MDHAGLLEWAEHEIVRTKEMLRVAEEYADTIRHKIRGDAALIYRRDYIETRLRCMGVPEDVWKNIGSLKELIKVAIERESFLNACTVREAECRWDEREAHTSPEGIPGELWSTIGSVSELIKAAIVRREFLCMRKTCEDKLR